MKRLALFFWLVGGLARAQIPGIFPWWDSPLVRDLNLSEEQRKQIRATIRDYRDRLIEQRAALQKAEARLQDLMNEDQVDEAKASEAVEQVIAARGELTRTLARMAVKMRQVLTVQQWQELQRRRMEPRVGPGGRWRRGQRLEQVPEPPRPAAPPPPAQPPRGPALDF
ncbi:MAG: Spy/CpxP family protein refolding chaperone [Bryobacterales bacterium]|nr:Spy/CpxP family protein refolding chaperone [Bryobacteraceae bacterium]MDW8354921.1 Spy/CpxP family protein refolding chaperone [Bryobacterales bacterium]